MQKTSAGVLMYRRKETGLEVFLIHPGGPYFRGKDEGAWSIPKGELDEGEEGLAAAKREFEEETGCRPEGVFGKLGQVRLKSGKIVLAWSVEGDCDAQAIRSNRFTMEWPPRSGRMQEFPEADRAAWFPVEDARKKINAAQQQFIDELVRSLHG